MCLDDDNQDLAAIESALRLGQIEIHNAEDSVTPGPAFDRGSVTSPSPGERHYAFAGWTLDATARDLVSPGAAGST